MKKESAFIVEVFPLAVPPTISMFIRFSIQSQRIASICAEKVPKERRCTGVIGSFWNFLTVNELPCVETTSL